MLPSAAREALRGHLADVRRIHEANLAGRQDDDLSPRHEPWRARREESDKSAVTWIRARLARTAGDRLSSLRGIPSR